MTEAFLIAVIVSIPPTLASIASILVSLGNSKRLVEVHLATNETIKRVEEVHEATNGMKDQLIAQARAAGRQEGIEGERERERQGSS